MWGLFLALKPLGFPLGNLAVFYSKKLAFFLQMYIIGDILLLKKGKYFDN